MVKKAWEIYAICSMLCALFEWWFSMINSATRNIATPCIAKNVGNTPHMKMIQAADWATRECGNVDAALSRASRCHYKTHEMNGFQSLMRVIDQITLETSLGPKQKEALDDIALTFYIRK